MQEAPTGTVSFLFTDIVGSTRLWEKFPTRMGAALARHDALISAAVETHGGHVFKRVGDASYAAFGAPGDSLRAAIDAQRALAAEDWNDIGALPVRMGIHVGAAEFRDGDYFGTTLNRASRIESAAHGGQILLSRIAVELLEDEPLDAISFRSLGNHRLRNLDRPEHLYQAVAPDLEESFPPPRSMEALPNNLPVQTTSFVGREKELEDVKRLLRGTRLLTLMGTGGTGKTRLALETGAQLISEFRDGVWLAELALIAEPERVVEAVAAAVDVREEPDRPLRSSLVSFFSGKNILLLLDNCEHLLSLVSALAAELLRSSTRLKILATSRHSLRIGGEATFFVPPLPVLDVRAEDFGSPDFARRLSQYEAVKLFVARAVAVSPAFVITSSNAPAVAEICSRLDGIPLAIELAAARVRLLNVDQIAARLDDRFRLLRSGSRDGLPHQQTLQALIDWSYDLLSEKERIAFRRMGVFGGGRTLEALEAVCSGDGVEETEVLDLLEQLVDKSLVTVEHDATGNPRYTMIESVWQYSREKLEASGEAPALRDRHLNYFLAFAEKAEPHLEGRDQKAWLDRCHTELFNFRFATEWTIKSRKTEAGLRFFSALYRVIEIRSNLAEAWELAMRLLELPDEGVAPRYKADARVAIGRLAWAADRYDEARRFYAEAQQIYEASGDEGGSILAEMLTGFLDRGDGDLESAERRFQRALKVGRKIKLAYVEAGSLSGLGSIAMDRGDLSVARQLKEQSLAIYERIGDRWIIGLILGGLTRVAIAQRDFSRAQSALTEWTQITRELGNRWILPDILDSYANLALVSNQPQRAARLFGTAEAVREHLGGLLSANEQAQHEASLATLKEMLPPEELNESWEAGRLASPWDAIEETHGSR
ncbi:MAG TPA: adenylate/guanylate cyclase domain-containing protein [Terrimicrobiaceae bacterium]